jgi:hypothetical protein
MAIDGNMDRKLTTILNNLDIIAARYPVASICDRFSISRKVMHDRILSRYGMPYSLIRKRAILPFIKRHARQKSQKEIRDNLKLSKRHIYRFYPATGDAYAP